MTMPTSGWDAALAARTREPDMLDERESIECGDDGPVVCPQCMGEAMLLGALGRVVHLRCRSCGWDFTEAEGVRWERT